MSKTIKFKDKYIGKLVDVTPTWGHPGQCVSLVQRFIIEELGVKAKARGNGEAWRTALINEGLGYRVDRKDIQIGDIIAWNGKLGHVAISLGGDKIFEQEGTDPLNPNISKARIGSAKSWDSRQGNIGVVTRLKNFTDASTTKLTEVKGILTVTASVGLNERTAPSTTAKVVKTNPKGTKLNYVGWLSDGKYYWYKLTNGNYAAYRVIGGEKFADYKDDALVEPVKSTPTPKYPIGTAVVVNGQLYTNSSMTTKGDTVRNKQTKVTRFVPGEKAPYNTTGDLGWVTEAQLSTPGKPPVKPSMPKTVRLSGSTMLYTNATNNNTYPSPSVNKATSLKPRTVNVLDQTNTRYKVRIPGFNPEIIWISKGQTK